MALPHLGFELSSSNRTIKIRFLNSRKMKVKNTKKIDNLILFNRFYHNNSLNKSIICELECLRDNDSNVLLDNVDFCDISEIPLVNFNIDFMIERFWRWLPIGDDFVGNCLIQLYARIPILNFV